MSSEKRDLSSLGTIREELRLSAFVDGECGWLKRILTKRTLQRSYEARKFVAELERTSTHLQQNYGPELKSLSGDISLWPKISARIAQEERLTLLRSMPVENVEPFSWGLRLGWSGVGALAASTLLFLYLPVAPDSKVSDIANSNKLAVLSNFDSTRLDKFADRGTQAKIVARSNSAAVAEVSRGSDNTRFLNSGFLPQVATVSEGAYEPGSKLSRDEYRSLELAALQGGRDTSERDPYVWKFIQQEPRFIDNNNSEGLSLRNERKVIAPHLFEVDWVRSNGRVRLLQDPRGNNAMIWVNKPKRAAASQTFQAKSGSPMVVQAGNR